MELLAEPNTQLEQKALNDAIRGWGARSFRELQREIFRLRIGVSGDASASMKWASYMKYGSIDKLTYKFERYMVFVHKGVGRGWPISRVQANAGAWSAAATGKRRIPKPWFNNVIEKNLQELADTAAKHKAEIAARRLMIK